MDFISLKRSFFSYLEENGKLEEINTGINTEESDNLTNDFDISIFQYAKEFKTFLQSEYDTTGINLMGKSISDILDMEIESGKLVDKEEVVEEGYDENDDEIENDEKIEKPDENPVTEKVEDNLEDELLSDMTSAEAGKVVDGFENEISSLVDEQVQQGEMNGFDIFKDVFNELTESSEFVNTIDTNKSNDIDKNELETFLNSIKGFDNNDEDVSVDDLLTTASQIQEGKFTFISTGNNSTDSGDIQDTDSVISGENNSSTEDNMPIDSTGVIDGSSDSLIGDNNIDVDISTDGGSMNSGSSLDGGIDDSGNLGSMTDELESLQQEKEETETDLSEQTDKYNSTQNEKEQVVGELSSEIETGNSELSDAQDEVGNAAQEKDNAESDVESAQQETQCSKAEADEAEQALSDAQNQTCESQNNVNSAEENNQQAIQNEQEAQEDSTAANDDLTTAVGNTNAAQGTADAKSGELQTATVEASEAFSVLNIKNQEVSKAQSEYNNAKAQQDNSNKNIFQRIASWVSSLFNKLQDAIMQRDHAQAEADRKEAEQEKAQVASDEALEALEQRKEEQNEAQAVADAAQVVLDRATGEREVSDQEYAEALVILASSMEAEENAESEYTTAFDNYLQCNNYQIDAEGRLQDANGNYISATQVAQELETYVQGLVESRDTKEKEYDDVIVATANVIAGDESKIQELDTKIKNLETQIEQEKENIALQEAMITELSTEQSEINAASGAGGIADGVVSLFGFGSAKDQKELNDKKAILEEALLSGDSQKIAEAYKAIYGDKEVVVDASGKVVDTSELSEEELAKCSVVTVKDLSNDNLSTLMHNEAAATENTVQTIDAINNGSVVCDGEEITMEEINAIIQEQVAAMAEDMDNAVSQQGIISKFAGGANNILGIGTSETEARAQIEVYQQLAAQLNSCTDPVEYAALFKQITGRDFNLESVVELYAYDKVSKGSSTSSTENTAGTEQSNKVDITSYVDSVTDTVNEDENLDKDSLSMTKDNPARESIEDYKETQETAKDAVVGVVSGVVSTAVVTVCSAAGICAAPFTAGASLGLVAAGFAIAGATGAAVSTGLNAIDSIYDKDGDGSLDFNYSWKEAGKDALIGSLNGIVGNLSSGVGAAVTGKISTQATQTAVTTTLKETIQKGVVNYGGKAAGAAVEGFIDGSISSSGEYAINALMDENIDFSLREFAETGLQGGLFGSVFNVGLTTAASGLSAVSDGFKAKNFEVDVNQFLADGTTNNKLAEVVAGKLDDSLLDPNGMVNHYAAGQLMKNAETALDSLEKHFKTVGLDPSDAIKVLDNVSLSEMSNVPAMISALKQLEISGIDMTTVDGVSDSLSKINDVKLNENGTLSSMKVVSDGQEITFDFDEKGNLTAIGLSESGDDVKVDGGDVDDIKTGSQVDDIKVDGGDVDDGIKHDIPTEEELYKNRLSDLENNHGLSGKQAKTIANMDETQYQRVVQSLDNGMNVDDAIKMSQFDDVKYNRAAMLATQGVEFATITKIIDDFDDIEIRRMCESLSSGNEYAYCMPSQNNVKGVFITKDGQIKIQQCSIQEINDLSSNKKALCMINNLDEKYDLINYVTHGQRLDSSLADYKIKIGNKEINILTDNNLVSEQYMIKYGANPNMQLFSSDMQEGLEDALRRMDAMGQPIPDKIYLTDLFDMHKFTNGTVQKPAGYFSNGSPNCIYVNSSSPMSVDYFKEVIYHESAHMEDFNLGKISYQKGIKINENLNYINFGSRTINTSDIERFISKYSLVNPAEFVAEITALITSGKIKIDRNGNYTFVTDMWGRYINAKGISTHFNQYKDGLILKDIIDLYIYLTDGKIAIPKVIV